MVGQSFAIVAVILVMIFMFLRAGRRAGALFALPLISVSVFHLLGVAIANLFAKTCGQLANICVVIDIIGLAIGLTLCWIMSRAITIKKLRYAYFASCAVFLAALATAYVNYLI